MAEEEIEDWLDEKKRKIVEIRNNYKQRGCDAIGWTQTEKGNFVLILYQDEKQRAWTAELNEDTVRLLEKWCEDWLSKNEGALIGYG